MLNRHFNVSEESGVSSLGEFEISVVSEMTLSAFQKDFSVDVLSLVFLLLFLSERLV